MWGGFGLVARCSVLSGNARFAQFDSTVGRMSAQDSASVHSILRGALRSGALTRTSKMNASAAATSIGMSQKLSSRRSFALIPESAVLTIRLTIDKCKVAVVPRKRPG